MDEKKKVCPILAASNGGNAMPDAYCMKEKCEWYCKWAGTSADCAVNLLCGMFADSTICRNLFENGDGNG